MEEGPWLEVWFSENQTDHMRISLRVREILHHEKSQYQEILVVDTYELGRTLILDDILQTSEFEEFTYHEMMAHVPMFAHPDPKRVLIVGGGDGGVLREVVRHPTVAEAHLVEIDERVLAATRKYLPSISSAFDHPKARVIVTDGIKHVADNPDSYDIIIVDSTDPMKHALGLFGEDFHRSAFRALREGGIYIQQSESPFYTPHLVRQIQVSLHKLFPKAGLYLGTVPLYPGGLWAYSYGAKGAFDTVVPEERVVERGFAQFGTRYYTPAVHAAAFALPPFVAALQRPEE